MWLMEQFDELVQVMARLRAPGGCPWDREQTPHTLRPYLLEESYEALEAIDQQDWDRLRDELGDVLLQVVFHARLASERGDFDIADVCEGIVAKMRRRPPHVFGAAQVSGSDEVLDRWEQIKRGEDGYQDRASALDGIPANLPALQRAAKMQRRAARTGFDWPDISGPRAKVDEELGELDCAARHELEHELGDLLFAVVNLARFLNIEPESALRTATARFEGRFRHIEEAAGGSEGLGQLTLPEMDVLWEQAKTDEREHNGQQP